jgi:hypothetical protein
MYILYIVVFDLAGGEFNTTRLLVLNIAYLIIVLAFSMYRMCPLTLWANWANRFPMCTRFTLLSPTSSSTSSSTCVRNMYRWLDSNILKAAAVLSINAAYLAKREKQSRR